MPWWRRLLCVVIGVPVGLLGLWIFSMLDHELHRPMLGYGVSLMLMAFGGLLTLSGLNPRIMRRY